MTEPTSGQPVPTPEEKPSTDAQQSSGFSQPYAAPQQAQQQQQQQQQTQQVPQYGYAQQNYPQQAAGSDFLAKLPMTPLTAGLFFGGLAMMLFSTLLHGAGSDAILLVRALSPLSLAPMYAILVISAITISTGPRFRPALRMIALSLAVVEFGMTMSIFMLDSIPTGPMGEGSTSQHNPDGGADIVGALLFLVAIGLLVAATFTMKERNQQPQPQFQQQYPAAGATGQFPQPQGTAAEYQAGQPAPNQWQQ